MTIEEIIDATARHWGFTAEHLLSRNRTTSVSHTRQIAMYLSHRLTGASLNTIGRSFDRDHSTVLYSIRRIKREQAKNPGLRKRINEVTISLDPQMAVLR